MQGLKMDDLRGLVAHFLNKEVGLPRIPQKSVGVLLRDKTKKV